MRVTHAEDLFVFAGAGASLSAPAGLPQFRWIRDALLGELRLDEYVPPSRPQDAGTEQQQVAAGLAPEPFFLALQRGGSDVVAWLRALLSRGTPNAAHVALAQLAARGARVWTVNF